jgi:hypothetical protein
MYCYYLYLCRGLPGRRHSCRPVDDAERQLHLRRPGLLVRGPRLQQQVAGWHGSHLDPACNGRHVEQGLADLRTPLGGVRSQTPGKNPRPIGLVPLLAFGVSLIAMNECLKETAGRKQESDSNGFLSSIDLQVSYVN